MTDDSTRNQIRATEGHRDAGNPVERLQAARALAAKGALEDALQAAPETAQGWELRGDVLLRLGRGEEALSAFAEAAGKDRFYFDSSSWIWRGDRLLHDGLLDLARRAYEHAVRADPRSAPAWHAVGRLEWAVGNRGAAHEAFSRAGRRDPNFALAFLDDGHVYYEDQEYEKAVGCYRRATEAAPDDPYAWMNMGSALLMLGKLDEALRSHERATTIDSRSPDAWNMLGNVHTFRGNLREALRCYDAAIEINNKFVWANNNRAKVLFELGRIDEALASIDGALEIDPKNSAFWDTKILILQAKGSDQMILEIADQLANTANFDSNPDLILVAAGAFIDLGHDHRARELLEGLDVQRFAEDDDRLTLAECMIKLNELERALEILKMFDQNRIYGFVKLVWASLLVMAEGLVQDGSGFADYFGEFSSIMAAESRQLPGARASWSCRGLAARVERSDINPVNKFVLQTLLDVQTGRLELAQLSYFAKLSGVAGTQDG